MPTNVEEKEVEKNYKELSELIDKVKGDENLIILADWNASIGKGDS